MKKQVLAVLLVFVSAVSFLFAGGEKEDGKPQIAVLLPGSVEFFSVEKQGMNKAADEFGLDLIYADAEWDAGKQLNQVENFVARGVDMILLCAADNKALLPAVDRCREADIPLITFTNVLGDDPEGKLDGVISFIGINDVVQGVKEGEMAAALLGDGPAHIVLIEGAPGTSSQRMRTQGFEQVAAQYPQWEIVYRQAINGWSKENALAAVEAFLQTGQDVDLISCHWHAGAAAAATALEEAGTEASRGKNIYVTGLEYTKELKPLIESGAVDATSFASIVDMGYQTVEAAAKTLKGETIPKVIKVDPIIITKENVDQFEPEM
ncbi:sugar ABC transporter substrate-binding protein [Sediminispirochaeta bajacaliforniensis]|uniref:sugar ABC transporter substrate-binding protein n=1 Tax=Sediminispirochaeta bajacaliforniensis TaxID=148 RepID=UPI000369B856|nr:sugar ABC transporter substrate-binding protein [Sediminispirochaeta bajacaliforniensis]